MDFKASLIVLSIFSFESINPQFTFPYYNQQQNHQQNPGPRQSNQFGFFPQQQQNLFGQNNFGFPNFQNFQNFAQNPQNFVQNQQNYNNRPNNQQLGSQNNYQQPNQQNHNQINNRPQPNRPVSTLNQAPIAQTTVRPVRTTQAPFRAVERISQRSKFCT